MKIPYTNIELGKVFNRSERKRRDMADIIKRIQKSQLVRIREDIDNWRNAMTRAESELMPDRTELIRIFKDIMLDAHLTSLVQTIVLKTISNPFFIENESGEIDEKMTEVFRKKWFRDFMRYVVEAPIYGSSLVQFGVVMNSQFSAAELVPREYVIPERRAVKENLFITDKDLMYFDERPFDMWTIFIHEKYDLGLLNKAAPLVIWKKNVLGAWSEAAEIFGMPVRMGKTDINNPVAYKNMVDMLENMGSASWAVMDMEDKLEFAEITKSDYYNVYDKLIDRTNSELSKLILGQTMSSDNGSSRSQAEVHERVLDDYVSASKTLVADIVNDQLIPLMVRHGIIKNGLVYRHDNEEKIDIKSRFEMIDSIAKWTGAKVPLDYVTEVTGIPLEEVEAPEVGPIAPIESEEGNESVMPTVKNLYEEITQHRH